MIFEGLKLATIGMLVVFAFLLFLVIVVHISTALLKPYTEKEQRETMVKRRRKKSSDSILDDGRVMAIISAAVAAHRARMQRLNQN